MLSVFQFRINDLSELIVGELALARLDQHVSKAFANDACSGRHATGFRPFGNRHTRSANRLNDFLVLQIAKRASDRVGIDGEFLGELADGRDEFARLDRSRRNREFDLAYDLFVDGNAVAGVDVKKHE